MSSSDRATRWLIRVQRARIAILVIYAFAVAWATWVAGHIPREAGIDRLIVPTDPDYIATRTFQSIFPEQQLVLVVLEVDDPWAPSSLARVQRAEASLAGNPAVHAFSLLDALGRARPGADPSTLRRLATGTDFFRRQGLVGAHFVTVMVSLDVRDGDARDAALQAVESSLARADVGPYHEVGAPIVACWLERQSSQSTTRAFTTFAVLLVVVAWYLYRSWRALVAILLALGATVVLALAAGARLGFVFTVVSALVPLTIMVTTLATLTYLHSRFVDQPRGTDVASHQIVALRNKLLPVTASTLAAAMGFASLAVSPIQPIRELGVWTATGLALSWLVAYTLFPALQLVLHTPTGLRVAIRGRRYEQLATALPRWTYRWRWGLVGSASAACAAGAVAIFGIPGVFTPMPVEVDTLSNIDPASAVARDLVWFRDHVTDLNIVRVWVHLPRPAATEPEVLYASDRLETRFEQIADVTSVAGPTTPLRLRSYFAGQGETLQQEQSRFAAAVADVEQLLLTEPDLRSFIDVDGLADMQVVIMFRQGDAAGYAALARHIGDAWESVAATSPALAGATMRVVGESLLQAKVGANLVPTLAESFLLTCALIFAVFLVIFRSGIERLLAIIPSLFALLVAFLALRGFGGTLNVATIIIATTVLGTTENDQLHFFHHMHERDGAPLEQRLGHALRVAGRAVVFATLINVCGFLGLSLSRFPPLRQFGLMTAASFVLALAGDLILLPAALWIASRERPSVERLTSSESESTRRLV